MELWARNVWEFCLSAGFHVTFRDLLHAIKLQHETDGFISPPKEGVLRIFLPKKIQRLWPGVNPRTWVLKASTLPLDQRSRSPMGYKLTHCGRVTQICVCTLQRCKTGDADLHLYITTVQDG
jgi:hypothetical protein